MTTVGLVHGAAGGAWVWEWVIRELRGMGFRALAMDMPTDDPKATLLDYRDRVVQAVAGTADDLVLAGHSFGGVTIPLVADVIPVRRLVFVCAVVPFPGKSRLEALREDPSQITPAVAQALAAGHPEEPTSARPTYEPGLPPDFFQVRRDRPNVSREEQIRGILSEKCQLKEWPRVECRYVLATRDDKVMPDWSRRFARGFLGIEPIEIEGGHAIHIYQPRAVAEAIVGGL